jgi:hypothetical protein
MQGSAADGDNTAKNHFREPDSHKQLEKLHSERPNNFIYSSEIIRVIKQKM